MPKLTLFKSTYPNSAKMLPPKKRAKIIAALKDNSNASAVARQVGGVCYETVRRIAKQTGIWLAAGRAAKGGKRLPPEKRAKIIAALKDNSNASAVARQVGGIDRSTVGKLAKQMGIELAAGRAAQGGKGLPPKTPAKIIAALKANPNASAVARQIGVSGPTVWKIAEREGIKLTAGQAARAAMLGPKIPSKKRAKIIAALKANPNASKVARQVGGVSRQTVGKIAKRTGIKLTDGRPRRGAGWRSKKRHE
jgi:hypothetical protein